MKYLKFALAAIATLSVGLSTSGHASILASDNFTLSSGSNVGSVTNTEATGVGTYTTILRSNGMSITTVPGFGTGNVLSLANVDNAYFRAFNENTTLTLNSLGTAQTLSLSFDIRFSGALTGADNFSFGFINNTSGSLNSILYGNIDLNSSNGAISEFRYRAGSPYMSDTAAQPTPSTVIGNVFTEPATAVNTNYQFTLSITNLGIDGFLIEYFRGNGLTAPTLISSTIQPNSSAFVTNMGNAPITGIAFRHSSNPGGITYIDNVVVSIIPEPSILGLAAFTLCLGLVACRRGRRPFVRDS